jgi:hypothetical protein
LRVQVINNEQHDSLKCHKNEVVSGHHSINREYSSLTDLKQLFISQLIPHYQPISLDCYQVDRARNMTEGDEFLAYIIAFNQLILGSL